MNKLKIIIVCGLIPFFVLIAFVLLKIKNREELQQKAVLAQEVRKILNHLMIDSLQVSEDAVIDVPADGLWYNHVVFVRPGQGALEYEIEAKRLLRIDNGRITMIADNIDNLRIRRQSVSPDMLEVQIQAKKNVTVLSYLKIRIRK